MLELNTIHEGNCLELMHRIPSGSIDMILCDLPYGVTKNKWDTAIPFIDLWAAYKRIIKQSGAIVLTAQDKFSAHLMLSNEGMHRYNLVWDKVLTSGFLNANRMPLRQHEDILIFYERLPTYNPQKIAGKLNHSKGGGKPLANNNYSAYTVKHNAEPHSDKFPGSVLRFAKPHAAVSVHPTQKPIALFEYLIKTYTNPGETVLDNCAGSCTTAIAALNTDRQYICIEQEAKYVIVGRRRVAERPVVLQFA